MNKLYSHIIAGLIPDKQLRRRVRDILLGKGAETADDFVHFNGIINFGDGFKRYFLKNNMPEKIAFLKRGLDQQSQDNVDLYLERMLMIPDCGLGQKYYKVSKEYWDSLYTEQESRLLKDYFANVMQYKRDFPLLDLDYVYHNPDVFQYHHGLRWMSEKLKNYIAGKDFVDGGAYVGDGALMLTKLYKPQKVYAFELSETNRGLFLQVMKINNISENKCELVPMGLFDSRKTIYINDTGGQGTSVLGMGNCGVEVTDLDSFAHERKLNVGFIKIDVEGAGYEALKGMLETIKRDRPVLSLAIYHTPQEFFDMKPLLVEAVKDLNYKILIDRYSPYLDWLAEIMIFAYPKELDEEEVT